MRRIVATTALVALAVALAVTGCAQAKKQLTLAGSSTGGTWYMFCGAVANALTQHLKNVEATPRPSAGSFENIRNIKAGQVDFGMVLPNVAVGAYAGKEPWTEAKYEGLRAVFNTYSFPYEIIVMADSPIKSIEDFKGRKIGGGPPGGTENFILEAVLNAYNLKMTDIKMVPLTDGERATALSDKQIEAGVWLVGVTSPTLKELATVHDVRFLPVNQDALKAINAKFPYYTVGKIASGTFKGQNADVPAIVMWGLMVCGDKLDANTVYNMVKTAFEYKSEIEAVVPLFKEVTLQNATLGISVPLHPGAEKFYREKGVIK